MSHQFTFASKRTFYFTSSSTRFDPCETRHAVLSVLDMIHHQYSVTELGLQRTARSEYYRRDTVTTTGGHVCGGLLSGPDIGAVYSERRNLSWSSGEIRKRSSQACCRQLEDRDTESLAWWFSRMFPQSGSVLVSRPPRSPMRSMPFGRLKSPTISSRTRTLRRRYGPSLRIFYALGTPHFPELN